MASSTNAQDEQNPALWNWLCEQARFAFVTRRPYCPGRPKKLCFTMLSLAPTVLTARLCVVKQNFFDLPGQYGRHVTKANGVILPAQNYLMCPTRIKSPWKLCNKFFIDHACSIKMAGHHFFFVNLWTSTSSQLACRAGKNFSCELSHHKKFICHLEFFR